MRPAVIILLVLALAVPAGAGHLPPLPSDSNGCSGGVSWFWRTVTHRVPVFERCCYRHDRAYRRGGIWSDRAQDDRDLGACVSRDDPFAGSVMFLFVVTFGQVHYPFDLKRIRFDHVALHVYARAGAE